MFNRLIVALLVVSLAACSGVPRFIPQWRAVPAEATATDPAVAAADRRAEDGAQSSPDARSEVAPPPDRAAKVVAAVLITVGLVLLMRGASRSFAHHIERTCCYR